MANIDTVSVHRCSGELDVHHVYRRVALVLEHITSRNPRNAHDTTCETNISRQTVIVETCCATPSVQRACPGSCFLGVTGSGSGLFRRVWWGGRGNRPEVRRRPCPAGVPHSPSMCLGENRCNRPCLTLRLRVRTTDGPVGRICSGAQKPAPHQNKAGGIDSPRSMWPHACGLGGPPPSFGLPPIFPTPSAPYGLGHLQGRQPACAQRHSASSRASDFRMRARSSCAGRRRIVAFWRLFVIRLRASTPAAPLCAAMWFTFSYRRARIIRTQGARCAAGRLPLRKESSAQSLEAGPCARVWARAALRSSAAFAVSFLVPVAPRCSPPQPPSPASFCALRLVSFRLFFFWGSRFRLPSPFSSLS